MNIQELQRRMDSLQKFFVDSKGEIYSTTGLHEQLARDICEEHRWNWRSEVGIFSAEDFLMHKKGFVKVSNYSDKAFRYIAMSKNYIRNKKVVDNAEYVGAIFNLRIEIY